MKNIHILKTDKPSRLLKDLVDETYQFKKKVSYGNRFELPLNIYITSDEEIKEGDWWLNLKTNDVDKCTHKSEVLLYNSEKYEYIKKIILTTDQDLIKDGVQAISDKFLEWFVKNPSCEYVKVIYKMRIFNIDELRERHFKGLPHLYSEKIGYKIIIPQEKTKQETSFEKTKNFFIKKIDEAIKNSEKEPKTKCYCGHTSYCDCIPLEPKQETLEEVAKKYAELSYYGDEVDAFVRGAKWQSERSYSEQDIHNILSNYRAFIYSGMKIPYFDWFEQFKKK